MSKKMSEHPQLFKLWKAGFFNKIQITEEQNLMKLRMYMIDVRILYIFF